MYCKHCGNQIDSDSTFCKNCGKAVSGSQGGKRGGSDIGRILYIIIAVICAASVPIAEYRRLVLGIFDATYWLCVAPILITGFILFKIVGGEKLAAEKEKKRIAKANGEVFNDDKLTKLTADSLSICCFIIAAFAFLSSGVIQIIFYTN